MRCGVVLSGPHSVNRTECVRSVGRFLWFGPGMDQVKAHGTFQKVRSECVVMGHKIRCIF